MTDAANFELDALTGACRNLAASLGRRVQGPPVATPAAIPWGPQAGLGADIRIALTHRGHDYVVTVGQDLLVEVREDNGASAAGLGGDASKITLLRKAVEALHRAVEAVQTESEIKAKAKSDATRRYRKAVNNPSGRGRGSSPARPRSRQVG